MTAKEENLKSHVQNAHMGNREVPTIWLQWWSMMCGMIYLFRFICWTKKNPKQTWQSEVHLCIKGNEIAPPNFLQSIKDFIQVVVTQILQEVSWKKPLRAHDSMPSKTNEKYLFRKEVYTVQWSRQKEGKCKELHCTVHCRDQCCRMGK